MMDKSDLVEQFPSLGKKVSAPTREALCLA